MFDRSGIGEAQVIVLQFLLVVALFAGKQFLGHTV